jgi:phage shock protein E
MSNQTLVFILILGAFVAFTVWRMQPEIPVSEIKSLINNGALLVDVRSPAEFAAGHIPGARNIPVDELERRVSELGDPSTAIIVYCRSGARSGSARSVLKGRGYSRVHNLGAMSNWK